MTNWKRSEHLKEKGKPNLQKEKHKLKLNKELSQLNLLQVDQHPCSAPGCDHFGHHCKWKKLLGKKFSKQVANLETTAVQKVACSLTRLLIV